MKLLTIYFGQKKANKQILKFNASKFTETKKKLEMKKVFSQYNGTKENSIDETNTQMQKKDNTGFAKSYSMGFFKKLEQK